MTELNLRDPECRAELRAQIAKWADSDMGGMLHAMVFGTLLRQYEELLAEVVAVEGRRPAGKLSELIAELQEAIAEYGDRQVRSYRFEFLTKEGQALGAFYDGIEDDEEEEG